MRPFTLLIKPASADCNLRCEYCFYLEKSRLYPETQVHRMSEDVLERIISGYMQTDQPQYVFNWQGGEPTLMGVDFYRRAVELQTHYGRRGSVVGNSIQTNATLLTDGFAEFMAEYKFLVGVSLDGPADAHNRFRKSAGGVGSHDLVMEGIERLTRNQVEFNILTLVSSANVGRGREVFGYLRDMGTHFHQYIPCVEFDAEGNPLPWAIAGEQWGAFLCDIYDEWMRSDPYATSVRLFDSILIHLVDGYKNLCHMDSDCSQYFVIEHNGDVYPCDFFVDPRLKLGDAGSCDWGMLQGSDSYREFGERKMLFDDECLGCERLQFCMGDCLKHRVGAGGEITRKSWLCEGWRMFYRHSLPGFRRLARSIVENRRLISGPNESHSDPDRTSIGRNGPCPCGSGTKYKKCHGRD